MQIVIDIPKETYEYYCKLADKGEVMNNIEEIIVGGKPLPKGHGRLIDADKVYDDYQNANYDFEEALEYAPTIIPADISTESPSIYPNSAEEVEE